MEDATPGRRSVEGKNTSMTHQTPARNKRVKKSEILGAPDAIPTDRKDWAAQPLAISARSQQELGKNGDSCQDVEPA